MRNNNNQINKQIFYFILSIYIFIIASGIMTISSPLWLKNISSAGQISEAIQYQNYGNYYLNQASFNKAIIQYKKAIQINPDFQEAYTNLGIAYNKIDDLKMALEYSKKALTFDGKSQNATYFNIAEIYEKNRQNEKAIKFYLEAAKTAGFPIFSYQKAGELLSNIQKWELAKQNFDKAIENKFTMENCYMGMLIRDLNLFPQEETKNEIKNQLNKGIKNIDLKKFDKTIFNEVLINDGVLAGIYNQYGFVYAMQGNMKEAIKYFEISLSMKPNFKEARTNLNAAMSKLKQ